MNQIILIKIRLVHKSYYRKSHSFKYIKSLKLGIFLKKYFFRLSYHIYYNPFKRMRWGIPPLASSRIEWLQTHINIVKLFLSNAQIPFSNTW
jgi:hypothetical protein